MMKNYHHGWVFKVAKLTDVYTYDHFKQDNPPSKAIYFLILRSNKRVEIFGGKNSYEPKENDSIFYYSDDSKN